ncbi:MAG: hypothetical protein ACM3PY_04685 [Omnitrophica WOR_2 bacterium]
MLDDLRKQADESELTQEEPEQDIYAFKDKPKPSQNYFLGMTPAQRLVIAFMLLVMTCILTSLFLLVTDKIVLPFM